MERIGLQAILDMSDMNSGKSKYLSAIGQMSSKTSGISGTITGALGKITGGLGGMATVAGGIVAANVFGKLSQGVASFVTEGLGAVNNAQMLEASLESLLTANNLYEQSTTSVTQAVVKSSAELANEAQALNDLQLKRETMNGRLQEQRERVRQMTEEWTEEGLATKTARARLAEMENELAKTDSEIASLTNTQTEYITTTEKTWNQVMSMAEAQGIAQKETQSLLQAIDKIAIVSPFEQDQVQQVAKFAVAAGLGVEETESFTGSFLDMAAAVGIGSNELSFAADQLLQVKKIGQLTTVDLRQLRRMGIDLEKIIGVEMGMSIEEFNEAAAKSPEIFDELFTAVDTFSQNTFAGATDRMATSLSGLQSTFGDIFSIGARNILRPLVDAASPAASEMLNNLADFFSGQRATDIGEALLAGIMSSFAAVSNLSSAVKPIIDGFRSAFSKFGTGQTLGGISIILGMIGLSPSAINQILSIVDFIAGQIQQKISTITNAFSSGGLAGGGSAILQLLGLSPAMASTVISIIEQIVSSIQSSIGPITTFIQNNATTIAGAIAGIRIALAAGAIASLIAGLGVAIAGLLTPMAAIIAVSALIGAALAGNWLGIRDIIQSTIDFVTGTLLPQFQSGFNSIMAQLAPSISVAREGIAGFLVNLQGLAPVWTAFMTNIQAALPGLMTLGELIGTGLTLAFQLLMFGISSLIESLGVLLPIIGQGLVAAFTVATNIISGFLNFAAGATTMLVGLFSGDLDQAREGAIQVFEGLRIAVVDSFMALAESLAKIIQDWLDDTIPDWERGLGDFLTAIALFGISALQLFGDFIEDIGDKFNVNTFVEFGKLAIEGLVKGIKDNADEVKSALSDIVRAGIDAVMTTLGIQSPSRVFANIGSQIIQGMVIGLKSESNVLWDQTEQAVTNAIGAGFSALSNMTGISFKSLGPGLGRFSKILHDEIVKDLISANLSGGARSGQIISNILGALMQNIEGVPQEVRQFASQFAGHIESALENELKPIVGNISRQIADGLLRGASAFADLGDTAVDRLLKPVEEELKVIQGELTSLQKETNLTVDGTFTDLIAEQERLTKLMNEGVRLTREERNLLDIINRTPQDELLASFNSQIEMLDSINGLESERADILQRQQTLKQQQEDLDFLQQQLGLLQTIESLGLDPSKILSGIKLGLDADLEDITSAMSAVLESILGTVDDTLQISSPSKVMVEKGKNIIAGLVEGIQTAAQVLPDIIQPSLLSPANQISGQNLIPATATSSTVNNNQTLSVNVEVRDDGMSPEQMKDFILRTVSEVL